LRWRAAINPQDKRRFPRIHLHLPVAAAQANETEEHAVHQAETANLSLGGLQLVLRGQTDLRVGDKLEITIDSLVFDRQINAQGTVRWLSPATTGQRGDWEVGVQLVNMGGIDWSRWFQLIPWPNNH